MGFLWSTSLSPERCLERLRKVSEAPRWVANPFRGGRPPLVLRTKGDLFWAAKNIPYNNLLRPFLRAKVGPAGGGARIHGRFELHPVNFWLLAAWYGLLTYLLFFKAPEAAAGFEQVWRFLIMMAFYIALPTLLWGLGTWLSRGEKDFLLEALSEVLQTHPVMWDDKRGKGGGS